MNTKHFFKKNLAKTSEIGDNAGSLYIDETWDLESA
jgi:hypothetical protein